MKTVYVGMSGGVDSSLTAALLKEQGYDVVGVYMKNWTEDLPGMRCPWADDLADAKRVAVQLGIPFRVYDFQKEYKQKVVDYMIAEYQAGRTPNPDIMCNQEIKFKLFFDSAMADGADMIATGHYAQVKYAAQPTMPTSDSEPRSALTTDMSYLTAAGNADVSETEQAGGSASECSDLVKQPTSLCRAVDTDKDQTYFLYRITAQALEKTLFPLGKYKKVQVRELAGERGLVTAHKRDSQGICFVGSVGIRDFLSRYVMSEPGDIVDQDTHKTIGRHDGAIYYTLGQRHGLNVGGGLPYYVVAKDMDKNVVYVSKNLNNQSMWRQELTLEDIHWIHDAPQSSNKLHARLRHRGALLPARLKGRQLLLSEPERAATSGQSAVIYRGDEVLGGGFIF